MKHITAVLRYVKENYPNVTPIMWDDMLRSIDLKMLKGNTAPYEKKTPQFPQHYLLFFTL